MGFFYSVRGWFEMNGEQLALVRQIVETNEDRNIHHDCWVIPSKCGGWSRFVFFGHTVRDAALEEVKRQIQRVAVSVKVQDGEYTDYVNGVFQVTPEDKSCEIVWKCADGNFQESVTNSAAKNENEA